MTRKHTNDLMERLEVGKEVVGEAAEEMGEEGGEFRGLVGEEEDLWLLGKWLTVGKGLHDCRLFSRNFEDLRFMLNS